MKLDYFNMPMHPPGSDFSKTLHDDLEQIEVLDRLRYSEAWIGEHFTAEWENIWIIGNPDEVANKIRAL
jgi:hypothetical protein